MNEYDEYPAEEIQYYYDDQNPLGSLVTVALLGLVAPFILWFVEQPFPYPYLFEELFKFYGVTMLLRRAPSVSSFTAALATGGMFALSETFFFFFQMMQVGTAQSLMGRLTLTIPMHIATAWIMHSLGKRLGVAGSIIGLIIGMAMHFGFNAIVAE